MGDQDDLEPHTTFVDFAATIVNRSFDEPLGLTLSSALAGDELVIQNIASSATAVIEWNQKNPRKKIRNGDEIRSVNGVKGDIDALVAALMATDRFELELRRKLNVQVSLRKHGQLGLKLDPDDLSVVQIKAGMIAEYNKSAQSPSMEIYPDDVIVEVNGCRGSTDELLAEITSAAE